MKLPSTGNWLIFGKVAIENQDGDDQNATVRLKFIAGSNTVILDQTDVRIPGGGSQSMSLQGWVVPGDLLANPLIQLSCATYNGTAKDAHLMAVSVDQIENRQL